MSAWDALCDVWGDQALKKYQAELENAKTDEERAAAQAKIDREKRARVQEDISSAMWSAHD